MRKLYGAGVCDSNSMENGKQTKCYYAWKDMLKRCYDNKYHARYPTYIGCSVDPEWHLFSKFKEFYNINYREGFQLDKDLLVSGNKVYSKETCRFVPSCINSLFLDSGAARGEYPVGVNYSNVHNNGRPYRTQLSTDGKQKFLGYFATPEEASNVYNLAKKEYCISIANREYDLGNIPLEIRDAILARF